ncbi:hypothetical protein GQ42DRAFT_172452 [Ramicandelaber brevisporus]|nr:hypothetical protein GQ42DRAFT_172452 [Ramicandelaber brevisporus]
MPYHGLYQYNPFGPVSSGESVYYTHTTSTTTTSTAVTPTKPTVSTIKSRTTEEEQRLETRRAAWRAWQKGLSGTKLQRRKMYLKLHGQGYRGAVLRFMVNNYPDAESAKEGVLKLGGPDHIAALFDQHLSEVNNSEASSSAPPSPSDELMLLDTVGYPVPAATATTMAAEYPSRKTRSMSMPHTTMVQMQTAVHQGMVALYPPVLALPHLQPRLQSQLQSQPQPRPRQSRSMSLSVTKCERISITNLLNPVLEEDDDDVDNESLSSSSSSSLSLNTIIRSTDDYPGITSTATRQTTEQ